MMILDPGKQLFHWHWENDIGDVVRIIVDDVQLGCRLAAATVRQLLCTFDSQRVIPCINLGR
jgi:hypothetical protein